MEVAIYITGYVIISLAVYWSAIKHVDRGNVKKETCDEIYKRVRDAEILPIIENVDDLKIHESAIKDTKTQILKIINDTSQEDMVK